MRAGQHGAVRLQRTRFLHFDAAAFRRFSIREGMGLEFRLEAFQRDQYAQFSNPNTELRTLASVRLRVMDGGNRSLEMAPGSISDRHVNGG